VRDTLYDEPAYYRALFAERTRDVRFYREVCGEDGVARDVLELGAGDGRVSLALAEDGHRVVELELGAGDGRVSQIGRAHV
jgi:hypothetical protein